MKLYLKPRPFQGKKMHADGTVDLEVTVPNSLKERVRKAAKREKISMTKLVAEAIAAQL
jgi:predicted HicB family RNase H-like nuclease